MHRSVVIAGGSGFLGVSLARHLASEGCAVTILSRSAPPRGGPWTHVAWDARTLGSWTGCLEGATGAGEPCRAHRRLHQDARSLRRDPALARGGHPDPRRRRAPARAPARRLGADEHRPHLRRPARGSCATRTPPSGTAWLRPSARTGRPRAARRCLRARVASFSAPRFVLGRAGGAMRKLVLLARLGLGGTSRQRPTGLELDPPARHEPALRARPSTTRP